MEQFDHLKLIDILLIGIGLLSLGLGIYQFHKSWDPPMRISERLRRSINVCVSIIVVTFCVFKVLDDFLSINGKEWSIHNYLLLIIFIIPFGILAGLGSYIRFLGYDQLLIFRDAQLKKFNQKNHE